MFVLSERGGAVPGSRLDFTLSPVDIMRTSDDSDLLAASTSDVPLSLATHPSDRGPSILENLRQYSGLSEGMLRWSGFTPRKESELEWRGLGGCSKLPSLSSAPPVCS